MPENEVPEPNKFSETPKGFAVLETAFSAGLFNIKELVDDDGVSPNGLEDGVVDVASSDLVALDPKDPNAGVVAVALEDEPKVNVDVGRAGDGDALLPNKNPVFLDSVGRLKGLGVVDAPNTEGEGLNPPEPDPPEVVEVAEGEVGAGSLNPPKPENV